MIDIQILPQQKKPNGQRDLRHRAVAMRDGVEVGRVTVGMRSAPLPVLCRVLWREGAAEDEVVNVWRGTMPIFMNTTIEYWASRSYSDTANESIKVRKLHDWKAMAMKEGDGSNGGEPIYDAEDGE